MAPWRILGEPGGEFLLQQGKAIGTRWLEGDFGPGFGEKIALDRTRYAASSQEPTAPMGLELRFGCCSTEPPR